MFCLSFRDNVEERISHTPVYFSRQTENKIKPYLILQVGHGHVCVVTSCFSSRANFKSGRCCHCVGSMLMRNITVATLPFESENFKDFRNRRSAFYENWISSRICTYNPCYFRDIFSHFFLLTSWLTDRLHWRTDFRLPTLKLSRHLPDFLFARDRFQDGENCLLEFVFTIKSTIIERLVQLLCPNFAYDER